MERRAGGVWPVRGRAADIALSAGTLAVVAVWGGAELDPLGWASAAISSGVLYLRRRYPVPVALVILAVCAAYYPLSTADGPVWPALLVALYTVAAETRPTAAVVITAVTLLIFAFTGYQTGTPHLANAAAFLLGGWFAAAVAVGAVVHNRRAYLRAAEERKEEELLLRASEERLRIARELHDVLGHSISLIHVQASTALHSGGRHPERAPEALAAIKETTKAALRELRGTLGVLRQEEAREAAGPAPGLADVGELVERARSAGLAITLRVDGAPRPVGAEVDLAAFRVVQESLTNVTRHAAATDVTVHLRYGEDELGVRVRDNGNGGNDRQDGHGGNGGSAVLAGTGSGLRGMRERVQELGGEFAASGRAGEGFEVRATFPVQKEGPTA
ncbi:sensor histidine kinase [Sphaerisporangium corydalis]|uniref:histidine kinase n=1 Tax=Sphaerisporangium corydalis TaxID=1441875 RepID=A0ABV9E878_9ACTN|nr:sensor histidine kinase [Sphaerisporangium corydalis]